MTVQSPNLSRRSGDSFTQNVKRCGRFINRQNLWYFKTREGVDYGPFENKTACRYAYLEFIDVVSTQIELSGVGIDFDVTISDMTDVAPNLTTSDELDREPDWKMPKISFF